MVSHPVQFGRASLLSTAVVLGIASLVGGVTQPAIAGGVPSVNTLEAAPSSNLESPDLSRAPVAEGSMRQVTSVSQLSDVQPTDWAFQALQSLVERYGCIAGYPNRTYRGNRPMSRYEFAAGLNACMERVNELITSATADKVTKADFETIKALQEKFAAELATLKGRVDTLEVRTKTLEAQQFSTTTKLAGEVIFAVSDAFSKDPTGRDAETVFQSRVRLNFLTSFTGKDRLRTRLQSSNAAQLVNGTNEGRFTYDGAVAGSLNHGVGIDIPDYTFPIGKKIKGWVFANGALHHYYADTVNPLLEGFGGGSGALSRFAERNPIYRIGAGGAGLAFNFKVNNYLKFDLGYLSNTAQSPNEDNGLFNGNYSALLQPVIQPTKKSNLGFTYVRGYDDARAFTLGGTGTVLANLRASTPNQPAETNSFGIEGSWRPLPKLQVGAWGGYTAVNYTLGAKDNEIWNYAVSLSFPDLGKKGALGAVIAGAEPYLGKAATNDVPIHVEAFYKYPVNDKISITPGLIWLGAPAQNSANDSIVIGTVRTTFTF